MTRPRECSSSPEVDRVTRRRNGTRASGATAPARFPRNPATADQDTSRAAAATDAASSEFVARVIANSGPPRPDALAALRRLLPPVDTATPHGRAA